MDTDFFSVFNAVFVFSKGVILQRNRLSGLSFSYEPSDIDFRSPTNCLVVYAGGAAGFWPCCPSPAFQPSVTAVE